MTKRLATMCLVTVLLVVVTSLYVYGQGDSLQTPTLKGIGAVYVLIGDLDNGAKKLGLTTETIRTDVELKLRLAGMRAVTSEESYKLPGSTLLQVDVIVTEAAIAASVSVALRQDALLERNGQLAFDVITWERKGVGSNPTAQKIRDVIKDQVDEFLNDWLSVNPKK